MVNIDTVYQKVLALANKEQRGYITPQEFNLLADKAQMEIFEEYFYDEDKARRMPSNDTIYSDKSNMVQEKIDYFEKHFEPVDMSNGSGIGMVPENYKLGELFYKPSSSDDKYYKIDKIHQNKLAYILSSHILKPSTTRPIYTKYPIVKDDNIGRERRIQVYPQTIINNVFCNYIVRPKAPNWGYVIVKSKPLYNYRTSSDFELHGSEEENLVNRIIQLSGVIIEDPEIQQAAMLDKQILNQQKNS